MHTCPPTQGNSQVGIDMIQRLNNSKGMVVQNAISQNELSKKLAYLTKYPTPRQTLAIRVKIE